MKKGKTAVRGAYSSPDVLFILTFLSFFAAGCMLLVVLGASGYKKTAASSEARFEQRTPLSYISAKVRQHDREGAVRVETREGVPVLILESGEGDDRMETWIYRHDGQLCEMYLDRGTSFGLQEGLAILPCGELSMELSENLLKIGIAGKDGAGGELLLTLRTRQDTGGGSA